MARISLVRPYVLPRKKRLTLANFVRRPPSAKCVFSRPIEIVTLHRKNGDLPKMVCRFSLGKTHFEKTHGNRQGFCLEVFNGFAFFIHLLFFHLSFVSFFALFFSIFRSSYVLSCFVLSFLFLLFFFSFFVLFFCLSCFLFFPFFFFFSVVRVDAKTGKISWGEVPIVKMTI